MTRLEDDDGPTFFLLNRGDRLEAEVDRLRGMVEGHATVLRTQDEVYRERDALVAALSKLWPSHLAWHGDPDWEDGWRNIVCVHSPVGQLTWHIQDDERPQFAHLLVADEHWDGHTTTEKYARLGALAALEGKPYKEGNDGQ